MDALPHVGFFLSQYYASGRQSHMFYICCTEKAIVLTNPAHYYHVSDKMFYVWKNTCGTIIEKTISHILITFFVEKVERKTLNMSAVAFCLIVRQPILHLDLVGSFF